MNKKEVAVIIVAWNSEKYLKECLDSLYQQNFTNFTLFFVDNNSPDNSGGIAKNYKNVELIKNKDNLGFAGGNNVGIKKALEKNYKYVLLANPDTVMDKDWLGSLYDTMEKHSEAGACQSKVLLYDSKLINTTGNILHYLGFSYCGDYKKEKSSETTQKITLASGSSVIFRSSVLRKAGLLDEDFFMYHEDVDLSWRIKECGYSLFFEPKSIIYHKYSFSRNKKKFYYAERNRLIFALKNYQLRTLILLSPVFFVTELLMIAYSIAGGWFNFKVDSYRDIIKSWGKIMKKRQEIQKNRTVSDSVLKKEFSKDLNFDEVNTPLFVPLNLFFRFYWFLIGIFI